MVFLRVFAIYVDAFAGLGCLRDPPSHNEAVQHRLASDCSLFHSVLYLWRMAACTSHGLALGVVRMASIGMLYLLLIAPVLTAIVFWRLRSQRTLSGFHRCAFLLSGAYTCFVIVAVPLWLTSPGVGR